MPDSGLAIHAGLPRTGTTTLQTHLFAAHSQIDYLGIFKGAIATRETRRNSLCRDLMIAELMRELLFDDPLAPDVPRCRALWRDICNRPRLGGMVWSWEGLATDVPRKREARPRNLASVMRPARVLITLRSPSSLLESLYFQILRRNNRGRRRPVWYRPIDEWLASQWNAEIAAILDYEHTVEMYARVFGDDAVHLLLFEELQRDPSSFVASICRLLAIDEKEGVRRTRGRQENPTSGRVVDIIRRSSGGLLGYLRRQAPISMQLRGWLPSTSRSATPRISDEGRERIAEHTRAGNRRLSERFGLDLERYGYPV